MFHHNPHLEGKVEPVPHGALGFDTDTKLNRDSATAFAEAGYQFAVRYLSLGLTELSGDLDTVEVEDILDAGLGLMPVQHVRMPGWFPTKLLGAYDGRNARVHAHRVGFPAKVNVWLDLEGVAPGTSAQSVIDYCNAWYESVHAWGYVPGVYVGANCGLTGEQLFHDLEFEHYWKSLSTVPELPARGYQMVQEIGEPVRGVSIDKNTASTDHLGDNAYWLHR